MNLISIAHAQSAAPQSGAESTLVSLLPIVVMFVILYFVMIRPQMKRQKETRAMINALTKGDEVVTTGGLVGRVTKVGDNYIQLEVADKLEVQLQRSAVSMVLPKGTIKAV
ncbi:SecYEG protein translocase auxillary subunit [Thiomonas sp. X19]|uniref:preprotein translocase subunit YajC n=1 Tax=Thiomonas sp. X19 TaxID=1050370 RepID=UPI000B756500|nr:preprotein translocase subunit YajC [Thiomonas sp. X19]SCC91227.1 SecYEG protein translocase auxillary subunit [Thiomonas sp. X19]